MARKHGPGVPYLFVTRSGNEPSGVGGAGCSDSDDPGNLLIVRLGSRDTNGERLRSNRLLRGWDSSGTSSMFGTPPDARDTVVKVINFDGQNGWPNYGHPGGVQLVGDILVVPLETPYDANDPENLILFLDVSDPENPVIINRFDPGTGPNFTAGLVGITPVASEFGTGNRYLMLVTGKENKEVLLYKSLPTNLDGYTDLRAPNLDWLFVRSWTEDQIEDCIPVDWHTGKGDAHQALSFVRESNLNGDLYLVGTRNSNPLPAGSDIMDLYRVNVDVFGNPEECLISYIGSKHVSSYPTMNGGDSANFAAAGGVYISPSGELIVYSTEFENDGPFDSLNQGGIIRQSVRFAEWRHKTMVRANSPTLKPTVHLGGPYEVDEGSSVAVSATSAGPITKAWLQLFEDDDLGAEVPEFTSDVWLIIDFEDREKDDFHNFREIAFNDDAGSWRWFAPVGTTLRVNDDDFDDSDFPGRFTKTLFGTGQVEEEPDLDKVRNDDGDLSMDDEITSMQFFADCAAYYSAPIAIAWDLDFDSTFETPGANANFSAENYDGPGQRVVLVKGQHPTDPTFLGQSDPIPVVIRIRNVAPSLQSLTLVDGLGLEVGTDTPFALKNLDYFLEGSFTDSGKLDTQSASIQWGDGAIDPSSDFMTFNDAFGGALGLVQHGHVYTAPGSVQIELEVVDDDGGRTAAALEIQVVSAAEALEALVEEIDLLLASTGHQATIKALNDVKDNLLGNNNGQAQNGALSNIEKGDLVAAMVKIDAAMKALEQAGQSGSIDLSGLKNLLGLAAESIARGAYVDAVARIGVSPRPDQAARLQMAAQALANGHARLVAAAFRAAIDEFKSAVSIASALPLRTTGQTRLPSRSLR